MRWILFLAGAASLAGAPTSGETRPIGIVETRAPFFPPTATILGFNEGKVSVIVSVDAAGQLKDALAVDATHETFAEVAVDAVRHWHFTPATVDGRPVDAVRLIRFQFDTEGTVVVSQTIDEQLVESFHSLLEKQYRYRAYQLEEVDHPPVALSTPVPPFPPALTGTKARVDLSYFIDQDGRVRLPVVTNDPPPAMATAALAAVRQWRFRPARKHGNPVLLQVGQSIRFGPEG